MISDSASGAGSRHLARIEEEVKRLKRRERHLRLAVRIATDEAAAADLAAKARQRVDLWRRNELCSSQYIEGWSEVLASPRQEIAKKMISFGDREDAMFQNSPFPWT